MSILIKKCFIIVFLYLAAATVGATDIDLLIAGGKEKIGYHRDGDIDYFSLSEFSSVLGDNISWDIVGLSVLYRAQGHSITIFADSPYLNADDSVLNFIYPALLIKGQLYLPCLTFIPIIDNIRSERVTWDGERKVIRVDSEYFTVTDLTISAKTNGLLIEVFLSKPKDYEIYISEGNWLNITIPDATVNRRQLLLRRDRDFVRDMNVFQFETTAQISLRFKQPIQKISSRLAQNPGRIQISLLDTAAVPIAGQAIGKIGPDNKIDKIIIDPGHGGNDYGAIGLDKTREKKIVLDIAKRLAKLIREEKLFEAVMTRTDDVYISLEERTRIANESAGDIYVSIHANASLNRSARGFQVFFLAPAKNDEARAAAQLENASFAEELGAYVSGEEDNLSFILSDMIQNEFQEESADLAAMIDREFRKSLSDKTKARGIDQAGFVVLNGVYMPSVLVEAAFLSNRQDEDLLNDKDYRQKVAEAIYEGLKRFKTKYESLQ